MDEEHSGQIREWETNGFTDLHPQAAPHWRVRFPHQPQAWRPLDAALAQEDRYWSEDDLADLQQAWAEGVRAEFPAGGPVRCDIRTFMPWDRFDLTCDFAFRIRHPHPEQVVQVLSDVPLSCVDEWGALWPHYDTDGEAYTPNFVAGPEVEDGTVAVRIDSKGVCYLPMWRSMLCLVRDRLVQAGVTGAVIVPLPNPDERPDDLGEDLLRPGDPGYEDLSAPDADPWQAMRSRIVADLQAGPPPPDLQHRVRALAPDPDTDLPELLAEICDLPGFLLAPLDFWKTHRDEVAALLLLRPDVGVRLSSMMPAGADPRSWLDVLDGFGLDPSTMPPAQLAVFTQQLIAGTSFLEHQRVPWLVTFLERVAPTLAAAGVRLRALDRIDFTSLDVVDLLYAHGLLDDAETGTFDLQRWLIDKNGDRRDLRALAGHPGYRDALLTSIATTIDSDRVPWRPRRLTEKVDTAWFLREVAEVPGLAELTRQWAHQQADALAGAGLPDAQMIVARLTGFACPGGRAVAADALQRLAGFDGVDQLVTTLRLGTLAEVGWPAYDEAVRELDGLGPIREFDAWPSLLLQAGDRVIVVDPDAVRARLALPEPNPWQLFEAGGDVLAVWSQRELHGVWLVDGGTVAVDRGEDWGHAGSLPLPDGSRLYDRTPLRRGDHRAGTARAMLACDGHTVWFEQRWDGNRVWRVLNPATGRLGEPGLPDWVQPPEQALVLGLMLRPPHPAVPDGPVHAGGLAMLWVNDGYLVRTADGVDLPVPASVGMPTTLLELPGADPLIVSWDGVYTQDGAPVAWLDHPAHRAGWAAQVPLTHWQNLRLRDPELSAALRRVRPDQVQGLVASEHRPQAVAELTRALGLERLDDAAATGLWELGRIVAGLRAAVDQALKAPAAQAPDPLEPVSELSDSRINSAMQGLSLGGCPREAHGFVGLETARALLAALYRGEPPPAADGAHDWLTVLIHPGAALARAMAGTTDAPDRATLLALVRALAGSGLLNPDIHHEIRSSEQRYKADNYPTGPGEVVLDAWYDGPTSLRNPMHLLVRRPDLRPGPDPQHWLALADAARSAPLWDTSAAPRLRELTGLTLAEATLLLTGLPGTRQLHWLAEATGLDADYLTIARRLLQERDQDGLRAVLAAAVPQDPTRLGQGPDVDAMAAEFGRRFWTLKPLPEDLVRRLVKAWPDIPNRQVHPIGVLRGLLGSTDNTLFVPRDPYLLDSPVPFGPAMGLLLWLVYTVPVDDPLRDELRPALIRLRDSLRHPDAIVDLGVARREYKDLPVSDRTLPDPIFLLTRWPLPNRWLRARPHLLTEADWRTLPDEAGPVGWWMSRTGAGFDRLLRDLTTEPRQGCLHDPRVSAPEVVADVVATLGLSQDAATLFLQLLALPDPTDAHVKAWNGWKPARFKEVVAELEQARADGAPLVIRGKRARSGRSLFLPGVWSDHFEKPNLPVENWKMRGLRISTTNPCGALYRLVVPIATHGRRFAETWTRWKDGDRPRDR